ncbi:MAG: M1 family aminopeptidase [Clostridia bacterium]|nr:M1 family aminopeptidase [Clostridia bacterium]
MKRFSFPWPASVSAFVRLFPSALARLLRGRGARLALCAAALSPLFGLAVHSAGTETDAALYLASPAVGGALAGGLAFALLALRILGHEQRSGMEALAGSAVSPLLMGCVRTAALLLLSLLGGMAASLTLLLLALRGLGSLFSLREYACTCALFLLPAFPFAVLAASALMQLTRRGGLALFALAAVTMASYPAQETGAYLACFLVPPPSVFSSALGNATVFRLAAYSRFMWLALLLGAWLLSLMTVREHGLGPVRSLLLHSRFPALPACAAGLLLFGALVLRAQPYMDHAAPPELDLSSETGGSYAFSYGEAEEAQPVTLLSTSSEVTLEPSLGLLSSRVVYRLQNESGEEQPLTLSLNPGYTVDAVTANGVPLPFADLQNDYYVGLKDVRLTLPADKTVELAVSYHGSPKLPGGTGLLFIYQEITPTYVALMTGDTAPSLSVQTAEDCRFTARVTLPESMALVSSGETPKTLELSGGLATYTLSGAGRGPLLFAGDYMTLPVEGVSFPASFSFGRALGRLLAEIDIQSLLRDTLSFCEAMLGPLPYGEQNPLHVVMTSAHMMGGGASQNVSFMGETCFTSANLANAVKGATDAEVIAHELIHQWWGIARYVLDEEHPAFTAEALTSYTTYRLMRELHGEAYAREHYVDVWQEQVRELDSSFYMQNPQYVDALPADAQAALGATIFDTNVYARAPLSIYCAEQLIGTQALDAALRALFEDTAQPFVTWQGFLDACGITQAQLDALAGKGV